MGVGDAAGTRTAVGPEQVLSSCSELCAFPTMWLRFGRSLASWCLGTGCDSQRMSLRECRPPPCHGVVLASWRLGPGCDSQRRSLRECRPPPCHGVVLASWHL